MTDFNDYYWFALVVEHNGFSATERATGIPKSRLSRRVQSLEQQLGVRLIQRTSRQFAVTDIGMRVYHHARAMLMEAQAAQEAIDHLQAEPRGTIRVSVPVNIAEQEMVYILPRFLQRYPDVKIQLMVSNRRVDIINEGIDVALRVRSQLDEDASFIIRRFGQINHRLVASTNYLNQYGRPNQPEQLTQHTTLSMSEDEINQHWMLEDQTGQVKRIKIQPTVMGSNFHMLTCFAEQGLGIALLPETMCAQQVRTGRLEVVLSDWKLAQGTFHAVYPSRRGMLPAVRVFIDYLVEELPTVLAQSQL
ncbi:LysR substrate-binding domain-containing protein [Alkanindiges sp. WGS2144]|uniref:LysR substrate-binding domain-containing protein n=1 Tax=Alkanindiges sp. WGS2144 TaxID=3366808 RepID=UPI0037521839